MGRKKKKLGGARKKLKNEKCEVFLELQISYHNIGGFFLIGSHNWAIFERFLVFLKEKTTRAEYYVWGRRRLLIFSLDLVGGAKKKSIIKETGNFSEIGGER